MYPVFSAPPAVQHRDSKESGSGRRRRIDRRVSPQWNTPGKFLLIEISEIEIHTTSVLFVQMLILRWKAWTSQSLRNQLLQAAAQGGWQRHRPAKLQLKNNNVPVTNKANKYVPKKACTYVLRVRAYMQGDWPLNLRTPGTKTKTFHNAPGPKICCTNTSRDPFQTTNQTKPMIKLIDICITQQL